MKYSRCGANECPVRIHCPTFVDGGKGGNTIFEGAGNGSCEVANPIVTGIPAPPPAAVAPDAPGVDPERRIGTDSVLGTTPLPPVDPPPTPPAFVPPPPGDDLAPPAGGVGGTNPVAPVVPPPFVAVPVVGTVEVVADPLCPPPPPPPLGMDAG